ncbi:pilus assembly protein PilM [Thermosyntropha sp.]|uniref:pilus assembly protein PilM n=1 Tax=Thermosyntropha sp. TaxID=2740820 RepID=UPI0025FBB56E|nr:pilus assembly protein PilM [Thermosyntropha sp.]MBO8158003.1 pilus assembly protein PilM [Thermosyntropha sp.]
MENAVFALDIGTRKIVGLIMQKVDDRFVVLDSEMIEHRTRAMLDGQIHDVEAVAAVIKEIKKGLEERNNIRLEKAAVAAAGRSLRTVMGEKQKKRVMLDEITVEEVQALEIEAVQEAQLKLMQGNNQGQEKADYFCVGYSVVYYELDGQKILSLVGQRGSHIKASVIATFLPRVVVDSLLSALKRAELDILSLTLEPIAALSVTIPPNMRLLNLALVDIGAGTSDIAIVRNGDIVAYAMVPIGGDELTESLASHYLLDFDEAEAFKRQLREKEEVRITDVLGNETLIMRDEAIKVMEPVIKELSQHIAGYITTLNQKAPDAVILIGGGSLTPTLTENIAKELNLPLNRVGIRTPDKFAHFDFKADYLKGPQGGTPLGIAYYSLTSPPMPFMKVTINGREIVLWNIGEISVSKALLSSGLPLGNIYGRPGLGKTIEINGSIRVLKGEVGTPPVIKVNGEDASLETMLKDGDVIEFIPGKEGREAKVVVKDLINAGESDYVIVNGESVEIGLNIEINGLPAGLDDEVPDRAKVLIKRMDAVKDVLVSAGIPSEYMEEKVYRYYFNGQEMFLRWLPLKVKMEGKPVSLSDTVYRGAEIQCEYGRLRPRLRDILKDGQINKIKVVVNGQEITLNSRPREIKVNGEKADPDMELLEDMRIEIEKDKSGAILSDIFKVIEIEPVSSGKLVMQVDGEPAGFTTPIFDNSVITIKWEK